MVINLQDLAEGVSVKLDTSQRLSVPSDYGLAAETVTVLFKGAVMRHEDEATVTGVLTAEIAMTCGRCLRDVAQYINVQVDERFKQTDESGECFVMHQETLDLTPMFLTNLVLNMPTKVLCDTRCKGLCLTCGADLNTEPCTCAKTPRNPHFEALSGIFESEQ
jgi:uncharacterized protein